MKLNKIISAATSLCIAGSCLTVTTTNASDIIASGNCGNTDENITWELDENGTLTLSGSGAVKEYSYSSRGWNRDYCDIDWISEAPPWFAIRDSIKKVVIEEGVTSLTECLFADCDNLKKIVYPKSLTTLEIGTFFHCDSYEVADLPENVTDYIEIYEGCYNLKSIYIPESVTYIGWDSFYNQKELQSLVIVNSDCEIFDDEDTIPNSTNLVIYGWRNSTAQAYAEKYGCNFKAIDDLGIGDVNEDGGINAIDASLTLGEYAAKATDGVSPILAHQKFIAEVNGDGALNALDASLILSYYAYTATGGKDSFENYIK